MQIEINESILSAAVTTVVQKAVQSGFSNYDLRETISTAAVAAITKADLPQRVGDELSRVLDLEVENIVRDAIAESIPAMRLAVTVTTKTMAARMLFGLRQGPNAYSDQEKQIWNECLTAVGAK